MNKNLLKKFIPKSIQMFWYQSEYKKYFRELRGQTKSFSDNKKTILIVNHFYEQDIKALRLSNKDYNFFEIDPSVLFKSAKIYFSEEVRGLNKKYDSEDAGNLRNWYRESNKIFSELKKIALFDAIITPADDFYWIREFVKTAKKSNVKTIILDKEGTITPYDFESESARIKRNAPVLSDYIFVWSARQKEYWIKKGVFEEQITILGQPRSDLFFREQSNYLVGFFEDSKKPLISFYSFENDAYVPLDQNGRPGFSWLSMKLQSHDFFSDLAKKHPEINFVIKTHPQQTDYLELKSKYERENLKVIGGAAISNELIVKSKLIIGFQTTAIVEALLMEKPIIYLNWDKHISLVENDILPLGAVPCIENASTFLEFRELVEQFVGGGFSSWSYLEEEQQKGREFVDSVFFCPNGRVCKRFFDCLALIL